MCVVNIALFYICVLFLFLFFYTRDKVIAKCIFYKALLETSIHIAGHAWSNEFRRLENILFIYTYLFILYFRPLTVHLRKRLARGGIIAQCCFHLCVWLSAHLHVCLLVVMCVLMMHFIRDLSIYLLNCVSNHLACYQSLWIQLVKIAVDIGA